MSTAPFLVRALPVLRWITFGVLILFSFIVMGVFVNLITLESNYGAPSDPFAGFAVAVPVLTLVFLLPMLVIDIFRHNSFTSMIVVELPVLGFFWIFWLALAAWASKTFSDAAMTCYSLKPGQSPLAQNVCTDIQVGLAFSWLNWISLFAYTGMLLSVSIVGAGKGGSVWTSSVRESDFGYGSAASGKMLNDHVQFPVKFEEGGERLP
ncbi:hypothetical protein BDW22DRAFT_1428353 [Trametopsis cervina]|nr:hypothetical protein BDW22DRAFT_1428353 [Trametopsis cervina]